MEHEDERGGKQALSIAAAYVRVRVLHVGMVGLCIADTVISYYYVHGLDGLRHGRTRNQKIEASSVLPYVTHRTRQQKMCVDNDK